MKEELYRPELIVALVGPIGTRLGDLSRVLKHQLATFDYQTEEIILSALLTNFEPTDRADRNELDRIRRLQSSGNRFRAFLNDGAVLARAGIAEIRIRRAAASGSPNLPASGHAYILSQLKHPKELELLREVYGTSLLVVAGHAPRETRAKELSIRMARSDGRPGEDAHYDADAYKLIDIDEKEGGDELGQNTLDTYPKADFFADLGIPSGEEEVRRFVDLVFGHPFHTPSYEEYAMYQASSISLRSSDDSRQVGAVIVDATFGNPKDPTKITNADIVAVGMNEVPRGGGGFYWDKDSPDKRDQALLRDSHEDRAKEIKISALTELIERIREREWLRESIEARPSKELARELIEELGRTQFMGISEFGRVVHAEMAAIIDAARRGVSVNGHTMYVTTFPCHNCAKHIIAAGLRKVVFLEPYSKSRATHLHREEICAEPADHREEEGKVTFVAFSGVGPTQYQHLFSMSKRGSKTGLALSDWELARRTLSPMYVTRNASHAYLVAECEELERLPTETYRWEKDAVCPAAEQGAEIE